MFKLSQVIKRILHPSPLPTVLLALFGYGFVLAVFVFDIQNPVLQIASYTASAYALVITFTGLPYVKTAVGVVKRYVAEHPLMGRFRSTAVGEKYLTDVRFRASISLWLGFIVNLLYIILKLVSGIYYRSAWFIALAVYYMLLAGMRLLLVRHVDVRDETAELRRYRLCGIVLLLMNQALAGIVVFIVRQNRGFDYPGLIIYAMAIYSFYAVITATVNIIRTRRHKSPVLSAAKAISFIAAMVSLLSLETAMLERFGGNDDPMFRRIMTGTTGGVVCTIVIFIAVYMIVRANKRISRIEHNSLQI